MDFGTKILGILMKHAILNYSNNGYEKVLLIIKHLQSIATIQMISEDDKKV